MGRFVAFLTHWTGSSAPALTLDDDGHATETKPSVLTDCPIMQAEASGMMTKAAAKGLVGWKRFMLLGFFAQLAASIPTVTVAPLNYPLTSTHLPSAEPLQEVRVPAIMELLTVLVLPSFGSLHDA